MQSILQGLSVAVMGALLAACSGGSTTVDRARHGTAGAPSEGGATTEGGDDAAGGAGAEAAGSSAEGGATVDGGSANGGDSAGGGRATGPAVLVDPIDGLEVDEAAGEATFTVVLGSEPDAEVSLELSNSAPEALTLDTLALVFSPDDWDEPRTVTLTGLDDSIADGDEAFVIITAPTVSDDPDYDGLNPPNVEGTVHDDDVAAVSLQGAQGLSTSELGDTVAFTVVLSSQPVSGVQIPISVSDDTEGLVAPSELTFTGANWDEPQTVTIIGLDDDESDGDVSYELVIGPTVSDDANYDGLMVPDVSVVNHDDDAPNVLVSPGEVTTSEGGGEAFFTVALTVAPNADVTFSVASSDPTEAIVAPTSLVFTPADWDSPQVVTVTGVDDTVVDGDASYSIRLGAAVSSDPAYSGLAPSAVAGTNLDDDTASVIVSPTAGLQTSEAGGTATFTVVLGGAPSSDVTLHLTSSDPNEGTVSPTSLVFTADDWDEAQLVTVTGQDDSASDGPVGYTITTSATSDDGAYDGIEVQDVAVTNLDDELVTAAVLVSPTAGLQTTEAGGTATFTVVLGAAPSSTVGVTLTVGDATEGTVDPTTLIFSSTTWSTPVTVTVTGLDDGIDDGDVTYSIATAVVSNDPSYSALEAPAISVTNRDDDEVGVTVTTGGILETSEDGGQATFTVVLDCAPAGSVLIPIESSDVGEGTVSTTGLTFTTSNYDVPQTVTVTGVNDTVDDGDVAYTILLGTPITSDPAYAALEPADVIVLNLDNDPYVSCANQNLIDDLEDGDLQICENGGRTGAWYAFTESLTGSQDLAIALEPREDSIVAVETTGTSISSWGATIGVSLFGVDLGTRLPYDVSSYTGIRFWARRGAASSYPGTVTVNIVQENTAITTQGGTCVETTTVECSDHYADTISVSSTWTRYTLPFSGFYQASTWGTTFSRDLEHVLGFEFLVDYSSFDLMIDDLELY